MEQAHAHQLGGAGRLAGALGGDAADVAAGEDQHRDLVALGDVAEQRAAGADLDVVGVRADREHGGARGRLAPRAERRQLVDLLDQRAAVDRLGEEVVGADADRLDGVVEAAVAGQDQRRDVRLGGLDLHHQLEAAHAGQLDVGDDQVPVLLAGGGDRRLGGRASSARARARA